MRTDPERQARFVDLVATHQGALRKVAALYAHDAADREDLLQEIALQLWRCFDSFRGEAAFSTFLYRVALNTALIRLRGSYRRPRIAPDRAVEELAAPAPTRDDEEVERLYAAIRQLGPVDRAILLLVLEGRSYDEIAAVTGLSAVNVGVRLSRGKERLRRLLGAGPAARKGTPCSTTT